MIKAHKYFMPLALCLLVILGAGCTKNNAVKLTYALGPGAGPCPGKAVVFKFEDKRTTTRLGNDNDGAVLESLSDVADWVGWALFDELKNAGCDAKYRTSSATPGDAALVTGEVLEISLNQTGSTTYAGRVVVKIMVTKAGKPVHSEKFLSQVEDVVLPGYGSRSDIMAETLRSLLAEAVPAVCAKL